MVWLRGFTGNRMRQTALLGEKASVNLNLNLSIRETGKTAEIL